MTIKIKYKDLKGKSEQELMEMKKQIEFHLQKANVPKNKGEKGFCIKQEKRNLARINTLIQEKILTKGGV